MNLEFLRPNQKLSNIKFNETPSRGSTFLPCGLTDGQRPKTDMKKATFKPAGKLIPIYFPQHKNFILVYHTYYLLAWWCRVLLEKLTGLQLVKKFPAFHGTRRFITALTSVRHLSLSWANTIQSIYPQPISWRSVLILSTHLRLGLPSGLLPSGFPPKTLYTPLSSPIRATWLAHRILLDFITRTILGEEYKSFCSSLQLWQSEDWKAFKAFRGHSVGICLVHLWNSGTTTHE